MKIHIAEDMEFERTSGRIQEISDDDDFVTEQCFICLNKGVISCEKYSEMSYCCSEHQMLHMPEMDETEMEGKSPSGNEPFPFMVKFKPGVGRYMVAARDIQPGELIFKEDPIAMGPNHSAPPTCLDCMRRVDGSYFCPNCNFPVCEEICAFGEEHSSKECKVFSELKDKVTINNFERVTAGYWCITVLRVLLMKETDPTKYCLVQRMVDHNKEHKKDAETWAMYKKNVVDFLLQKCGLKDRFSEEEVFHVLGAIDVNSVKIHCTRHMAQPGSPMHPGHALFPVTALLSHSCICNSKTILKDDYSNECRATVFIPRGEEITKQYVSPLETTNMRRDKLQSGWHFSCQCYRCIDPTENDSFVSATACLRCQGGNILPKNPIDPKSDWLCQTCGFQGEAVDKLVSYFLSKLHSLPCESLDDWEDLLTKALKMFHPNHYVVMLLRISMNSHYIRLSSRVGLEPEDIPVEVFMRRKDLLDEVHRVIEIVEPGLSRRRGISLFETSTCHLQIGRLLHESDRFPIDDCIQLCETEIISLKA